MHVRRARSNRGRPIRGVVLLTGALALTALLFVAGAGARFVSHLGSAARLRILYASDWTGPMEIFAADPTGRTPVRQVTFARPDTGCYSVAACGFTDPLPSPDGRLLAYWSSGP